ncbi:MAG: YoaK family protein [Terriglobales bacterium]
MHASAPAQPIPLRRSKAVVALLLTFSAGCVDIVGYLTLYQMFTAHMTGDTVHLGESVLGARWMDAASAGCIIAAFLFGSIAGRTLIEIGSRRRFRSIASTNLLLEAALIAAVVPLASPGGRHVLPLLAMLAAAMGMQTATLTRIGSLTVHTTFVTGMLNKLAQLLSHAAFVTYDIAQGREKTAHRRRILREAQFISSIWMVYLAGAVTGTWLRSLWDIRALWVPAAVVALTLLADQVSPLSVEEEHEEPAE